MQCPSAWHKIEKLLCVPTTTTTKAEKNVKTYEIVTKMRLKLAICVTRLDLWPTETPTSISIRFTWPSLGRRWPQRVGSENYSQAA